MRSIKASPTEYGIDLLKAKEVVQEARTRIPQIQI
jgi:hypothetical protein